MRSAVSARALWLSETHDAKHHGADDLSPENSSKNK